VVFASGGCACVEAGPVIWLGQREGDGQVPSTRPQQKGPALCLGAMFGNRVSKRVMDVHHRPDAAVDLGYLRNDWEVLARGKAAAPVLLRHQQSEGVHGLEAWPDDIEGDLLAILNVVRKRRYVPPKRSEEPLSPAQIGGVLHVCIIPTVRYNS